LPKVVPKEWLQIFTAEELEMILFGLPIISLEDWRTHTYYKGDYTADDQRVTWFWDILSSTFSSEELSQFLQFCTGSSRVPVEGFRYRK
jgi:E3 ubiquitin-protein ligase HUWE1